MAYCRPFLCGVQLYLTFSHCKWFHPLRALNLLNIRFPIQTACIYPTFLKYGDDDDDDDDDDDELFLWYG